MGIPCIGVNHYTCLIQCHWLYFGIKGLDKIPDTILNDLLRTEDHQPESKQYQGTIQ